MSKIKGRAVLRGHISGLVVLYHVMDALGGRKIALIPGLVVAFKNEEIQVRNYEDDVYSCLSLFS